MQVPNWTPKIDQVLGVKSERKMLRSKKGTEYETDVIPEYPCVIIGSPTEKHDENGDVNGYSYQVYDAVRDLGGFSITVPQKVESSNPITKVVFYGLRGGALSIPGHSTGWFKADKIELLK